MKTLKNLIVTAGLALLTSTAVNAQYQVYPGKYAVKFTDKNFSNYLVSKPDEFLSQKALERRKKFSIDVNTQDLPVSQLYVDSLKKMGFEIHGVSKWLNCAIVICDSAKITELKNISFVDYNYNWRKKSPKTPYNPDLTRPKFKKEKNVNTASTLKYGKSANQNEMLNIQMLHNQGFKGQGVVIALLDAGFYHANVLPAFKQAFDNGHFLGAYDFVDRDTTVFGSDTHGMNALSCIVANIPNEFIGTAPEASFYLFRTEDGATENIIEEFNWAMAAEKADSLGVDLIHSSLGYNDFDDDTKTYQVEDIDGNTAISTIAADIAASKGIVVTVSAGNEGDEPWRYVSSPADADSILGVGAVDKNRKLAYFSSRGPTADNRVKPDACAKGLSTAVEGASGHTTTSNGTSFSGPVLAGAVTCLIQAHPKASPMDIINAVRAAGDRYNNPDGDYGYGIPDFYIAHKILLQKKL